MSRRRLRRELLAGPSVGSAAVAAGLITAKQLRGPSVTRLFRDVYIAGAKADVADRARGAFLLLPDTAAFSAFDDHKGQYQPRIAYTVLALATGGRSTTGRWNVVGTAAVSGVILMRAGVRPPD